MKLTTERTASAKALHAGISSDDEVYAVFCVVKALDELVTKNGYSDAVAKLGRGKGSNLVRFAMAVACETIMTGHKVILIGSELKLKEPKRGSWVKRLTAALSLESPKKTP